MQDAPPIGRPSKIVEVDGRTYRVIQAPPRQACRLAFVLFQQVGRPLIALLAGGYIDVPTAAGGTERLGLREAWESPPQRVHLLTTLSTKLAETDPEIVDTVVRGLLVGNVEVDRGGWIALTDIDDIDAEVYSVLALVRLIAAAAEVTILPFAQGDTGGGSSPAKT